MAMKTKRYIPSTDSLERLFAFYKRVYPDAPWLVDKERFNWQHFGNPLLKSDENHVWLLVDDSNEIIGQNIYIPYNLCVDGKICSAFCSTNLIVKPGMEGKGIGHKLIAVNESLGGIPFAVGITTASKRAFLKRGWKLNSDSTLCSRFINPIPNLKYIKLSTWKMFVVTPVIYLFNLESDL